MKKKLLYLFLLLLIPTNINAATSSSKIGYDLSKYECTSAYQDSNISTSTDTYFSYCMKAVCDGNSYNIEYYSAVYENRGVNCLNGNNNPYYNLEENKNGCRNYNTCNERGEIKYCSINMYYDCTRKSDGTSFTTTTKSTTKKTTKPTTKKPTTTTTTTTTTIVYSTKLKSLSLSKGSIIFNPDIYEYTINLNEEDTSIDVTAIPEDNNCKTEVKNNYNLANGSVISIIVTSPNGENAEYKINVKKNIKLSNNTNLKSLTVKGYDLGFSKSIKDYTLVIKEDTKTLDINYELEDSKSTVLIMNNNDLVNGSKVTISVTAEDGTVTYYYINILFEKKSNTLGIIFIIILILALLAGAYYLYVKFVVSKRGEKYEYE